MDFEETPHETQDEQLRAEMKSHMGIERKQVSFAYILRAETEARKPEVITIEDSQVKFLREHRSDSSASCVRTLLEESSDASYEPPPKKAKGSTDKADELVEYAVSVGKFPPECVQYRFEFDTEPPFKHSQVECAHVGICCDEIRAIVFSVRQRRVFVRLLELR